MVRLVLGIAVGCVLGAKAGHERYEQILRVTSKAVDNPAVQGVAGFVPAKMSSVLPHRNRREPRRPDLAYLVDVEEIHEGPAAALTSVSTSSINQRPSRPWWNQIVLPTSEQIRPRDGSPHHSTARIPRPGEDVRSCASPGRSSNSADWNPVEITTPTASYHRFPCARSDRTPAGCIRVRPRPGNLDAGQPGTIPEDQQGRVEHRQKADELGEQCREHDSISCTYGPSHERW